MDKKKVYDVVIAGAGPSGLMALRELYGKADVLCIDPKEEIGAPLKCGEGIRVRDFDELFGKRKFPFIINRIEENQVLFGKYKRTFKLPYYKVSRVDFEKWLSTPLMHKIELKTSLEDVDLKNKKYLILKTNKGKIKSKMLILASGCHYAIQKKAGMINRDISTAIGYGGIFKNVKVDADKFYYHFDKKHCGYFWVFPNSKGEANIGFGAFNQKKRVKEIFYELKNKFGYGDAIAIREYAGVVPTMGPIKSFSNRILAAGNAAGMVYAGSGEGISYALQSGKFAGKTALEAIKLDDFSSNLLKQYESTWKKKFGKELNAGLMFRDLFFFGYKFKKLKTLLKRPTDQEIFNLVNGKPPLKATIVWFLLKTFYLKKTHF